MLFVSDSIILATEQKSPALVALCRIIASIQFNLLKEGFLVRGGISRGSAQVEFDGKEKVILGPAFTRAVMLEKSAKYPRVILDPGIISDHGVSRELFVRREMVTKSQPSEQEMNVFMSSDEERTTHYDFLYRDHHLFVDYLADAVLNKDAEFFEFLWNFIKTHLYTASSWTEKYHWLKDFTISSIDNYTARVPDFGTAASHNFRRL